MKAAFTPGTTFASYRVESLLGRGGMGVVYLAPRPVARAAGRAQADRAGAGRRTRSSGAASCASRELAASLDHPNVIPIYEAGEHDGQLYLAMRYVQGQRPASAARARGQALARAHARRSSPRSRARSTPRTDRGLVHRDVKPANVLLDEDGHAYLTDFGITKQAGRRLDRHRARWSGTLDYLAPEQIRGEPVDGRTDCYALACVLYECLTGDAAVPPRDRGRDAVGAHAGRAAPRCAAQPALDRGAATRRWPRRGTSATRPARASSPQPRTRSALAPPRTAAARRARAAAPAPPRAGRLLVAGGLRPAGRRGRRRARR